MKSRRKAKSSKQFKRTPRIEPCAECGKSLDLNGSGWLVNGNGLLLCGHECFEKVWQRAERLAKGEATWEDL